MSPLRLIAVLACLFSPLAVQAQREKFSMEELEVIEKQWPAAQRTPTGLRTLVLAPGTGSEPRPGDEVRVLYTGRLLNGQVFDKQVNREKPFSFRVGRKQVIAGWDEGLLLMKTGERRLLLIPYELAYGTRGRPPVIPRSASLVFEVELVEIRPTATP